MKVIVTGASGYIGRHVFKFLSDSLNCEVVGLVREKRGLSNNNLIEMDIAREVKEGRFGNVISPGDCLIHLAYRNGFDHQNISHLQDLAWHYELVRQSVLKGCDNVNVMGSVHEIGYYQGAVTGSTLCNPISLYGIAKNALRQALLAESQKVGYLFKWFRGFYIYGDDYYSNSIFGKIYRTARSKEGKKEFNLTTGNNKFDFINVDDLAKMISIASLQTDILGVINTCSGKPKTLRSAIEKYVADNGLKIKLNFGKYPEREGESPCIYGNDELITKILSNWESKPDVDCIN